IADALQGFDVPAKPLKRAVNGHIHILRQVVAHQQDAWPLLGRLGIGRQLRAGFGQGVLRSQSLRIGLRRQSRRKDLAHALLWRRRARPDTLPPMSIAPISAESRPDRYRLAVLIDADNASA